MDPNRKQWNLGQQALRKALARPETHSQAVEQFLIQHAMCHAANMSRAGVVSFEDEIWNGLDDASPRWISQEFGHSIVWCFWHLTRIEDVTMNMLLAGTSQLFLRDGWFERLGTPFRHTGNGMDDNEVAMLSTSIDIAALRAYRLSVGKLTRKIVRGCSSTDLLRKVEPVRLEKVMAEGAVIEAGRGVIKYWSGLTGAGLLLMPPTRHALLHLNEMAKIKYYAIGK
jgi:DinB superfamily